MKAVRLTTKSCPLMPDSMTESESQLIPVLKRIYLNESALFIQRGPRQVPSPERNTRALTQPLRCLLGAQALHRVAPPLPRHVQPPSVAGVVFFREEGGEPGASARQGARSAPVQVAMTRGLTTLQ